MTPWHRNEYVLKGLFLGLWVFFALQVPANTADAWKDILKQKGWDDAYLGGDAFADFLKKETTRVTDVLKSVGLVKS